MDGYFSWFELVLKWFGFKGFLVIFELSGFGLSVWSYRLFWSISSYYIWRFGVKSVFCWIYGGFEMIEVVDWWEFGLLGYVIFVGFVGFYRSMCRSDFGGFEVGWGWWWEIWRWEVEIFELRCGWNWYALLAKRTLVLKCKLRPVRTQKSWIDNINKGQIVSFWYSIDMLCYVVINTILWGFCLFFYGLAQ